MFRILLLTTYVFLHPVHVTVMSLDYFSREKELKGFLKIYYDDFLLDLGMTGADTSGIKLNVSSEKNKELIVSFLEKKVTISGGERIFKPELVEMTLADNELKLGLVYSVKRKLKSIKVHNSILSDIYADQSNLVLIKYGSFEEGVKLTPEMREYIFSFK
jgi:hypothetical protein